MEITEYPADQPSERPRPRLGDLVVERAMVSREHLDLCLAYQQALREGPDHVLKPLGEILVEKGLLRQEEVDGLLKELENWEARKLVRPAPVMAAPKPAAKAAGAKPRREKPREKEPTDEAEPAKRKGLGGTVALLAAAGAVVASVVAYQFWPREDGRATLAEYLKSCAEGSKPNAELAVSDLGIEVRQFEINSAGAATRFDYGGELRAYGGSQGAVDWEEFLAVTGMQGDKHKALSALLPAFPGNVKPKTIGSLAVTMQSFRCSVVFRPREKKLFKKAEAQFALVKAASPRWSPGWRVAAVEVSGGD